MNSPSKIQGTFQSRKRKADSSITEFLSLPENIRLALHVAEAMGDVFRDLRMKFATALLSGLKARLKGKTIYRHFRFETGEELGRNFRYYGVWGIPEGIAQEYYLYYIIAYAEEGGEHYLYYGLEWGSANSAEPPGYSTKTSPLRDYLIDNGYEVNKWSYGWKTIEQYSDHREFVIALAERSAYLVEECLNLFENFFEQTAEMVMATNKRLKTVRASR